MELRRSAVPLIAGVIGLSGAGAFAPAASAGTTGLSRPAGTTGLARPAAGRGVVCQATATTAPPAVATLTGVTSVSPRLGWAVGWTKGNPPEPVVASYDGNSWIRDFNPALQVPGELTAVAKYPGGVWAVGGSGTTAGGASRKHLIFRIADGKIQAMPLPGPAAGQLLGVAATAAKDAWAVGYNAGDGPLILHWNGAKWTRSALPRSAAGRVKAVAASSSTNAWAITTGTKNAQVLHWNGQRWSLVTVPAIAGHQYELEGVAATSVTNAWIVGVWRGDVLHPVMLHWNGTSWKPVPTGDPATFPDGDNLTAVSALNAHNAWAVGSAGNALALHWDGKSWQSVPTSNCAGLNAISILPSGRAWAVGAIGFQQPQILHWTGTAWHSILLVN
jgi:hypothetical protein